jgi:arylsulfatase A-like enzyme
MEKKSFSDYNIILINLDGLREDQVELCNYLKSLKEKNFYFSNMISVSPYTLAAHHSIISGLYPSQHGIDAYHNMFKFKKDTVTTIPELLKNANYFTRCDCASKILMTNKGFDQFKLFDEYTVDYKTRWENILTEISKQDKFFLFLQYSKLHSHLVKEVMEKYDLKSNDDEYFDNIENNRIRNNSHLDEMDDVVKNLFFNLDKLSLTDKTIVIFTSDHGTSIGEKKGERFYGTYTYDYTINVFLLMIVPNEIPKIINHQCSHLDIFPTITEIANLNLDEYCKNMPGKTLFNFIYDVESTDREVFVETGGLNGYWPSPKKHNVFCVRKNGKKLIYNDSPQTWEFYDLENDPLEKNNIYDSSLEEIKHFKNRLIHYLSTLQKNTNLMY